MSERQFIPEVRFASDVAEISVFIANNHTNNLTVNETDPVTLQCTAVGRPTPAMRIVKNRQRVADRPRGQVSPEDTATLVHRVSRAECSEAPYRVSTAGQRQPGWTRGVRHPSGQL